MYFAGLLLGKKLAAGSNPAAGFDKSRP